VTSSNPEVGCSNPPPAGCRRHLTPLGPLPGANMKPASQRSNDDPLVTIGQGDAKSVPMVADRIWQALP